VAEVKASTKLNLTDILENPIEEVDVPGIGIVKVRCPTIKEKLDAKREAITIGNGLSDNDKALESTKLLAIKMIVEPKITLEQYLESNDSKISIIIDTVDIWYTLKLKGMNDKRKNIIKDFLAQMRDLNQ
jgi:hypothetical protein